METKRILLIATYPSATVKWKVGTPKKCLEMLRRWSYGTSFFMSKEQSKGMLHADLWRVYCSRTFSSKESQSRCLEERIITQTNRCHGFMDFVRIYILCLVTPSSSRIGKVDAHIKMKRKDMIERKKISYKTVIRSQNKIIDICYARFWMNFLYVTVDCGP